MLINSFGQIGGEEKAGMAPILKNENIGPALGFNSLLGEKKEEVIGTLICGDNYFNENKRRSFRIYNESNKKNNNPDMVVAGPAFNAGRYGMAAQELLMQ